MKNCLIIILSLYYFAGFAQEYEPHGSYHPEDSQIGLPDLDFTGKALIIGVVLFAIGWIISRNTKQENGEKGSLYGGCLIAIGFCCAIPALAWVQTIGATIYIVFIIIAVIFGIIHFLTRKSK